MARLGCLFPREQNAGSLPHVCHPTPTAPTHLQDRAITKAVWDLLMSLPTQCELVRRVKETALATAAAAAAGGSAAEGPSAMEEEDVPAAEGGGGGNGNGDGVGVASATWAELLPVGRNWHKTVYTLQIIDALLFPAPVGVLFYFIFLGCVP